MDNMQATSHSKSRDPDDAVLPSIQDASEHLAEINSRALSFVREHPIPCIVGALSLGFIVGKIASRS